MPFIPRWLKDHFQIKVAMFILAAMLWFLVVTEKSHEYTLHLPIEISNLKSDWVLSAPIPETADVKFMAGGKAMLRLLFVQGPLIRINLASIDYKTSAYSFKHALKTEMVVIPGAIEAVPLEIETPDSVLIQIEESMEIKVPVQPQISIKTADGYTTVGNIRLNPSDVNVFGPKSVVSKLKSISSKPLEITDARRNTELTLTLLQPEDFGIVIDPNQIQAVVQVERIGERVFEGIPLTVKNQPWGRTVLVEPGSVDVTLVGAVSLLADLDSEEIGAWVDHRELNPRKANLAPVHLDLKPEMEILQVIPEEVRLIVRRN